MRRVVFAGLALTSAALVGCSGGDGGGGSSTEAAVLSDADKDRRNDLVQYFSDPLGDDGAFCVADEAFGTLGPEAHDVTALGDDVFDLTDFPSADRAVLVAAIDECVELDEALASFAENLLESGAIPLSRDDAMCAVKEIGTAYTSAGQFYTEASRMSEEESGIEMVDALESCMDEESGVAFMQAVLDEQGLDADTSRCVAEGLVERVGVTGVLNLVTDVGRGDTEALVAAGDEAYADCEPG